MKARTTRARQWRAALLALLLAFVASLTSLAVGEERPSDQFVLEGIPAEEITGGVLSIKRLRWDTDVPVTRDAAVRQAVRTYPGGLPRQVALVRIRSTVDPSMNRDAWAVNFDPSTVSPMPPFGMDAPPGPYESVYAFVFVDAHTSDFVFAGDRARPAYASPTPSQ